MSKSKATLKPAIPLNQCHLYGVRSTHLLAKKLGFSLATLEALSKNAKYRVFNLKDSGRLVEEPPPSLQAVHRKIHRYLSRIQTPKYLHSAIKGRSYITNAKSHIGIGPMIKIDVKKFFPSVLQHKVMHFFRDVMNCAADVAGLLANLLCKDGKLPTGGAASPIISYYSHKSMFDEISDLCISAKLTFSCYVDDIAISGFGANRGFLHKVRLIIAQNGLKSHKAKFYDATRPKTVTGIMVRGNRLELPNSRWKAIKLAEKALVSATNDDERLKLYPALVSRLHEAAQIDPACRRAALRHNLEWRALRLRKAATKSASSK